MKDTYCVIMSGGIGSRFWPLSRASKPKQFLDFFGNGSSLLQMTVKRFAKLIPEENIYIVTNKRYAQLVKEQFPSFRDEQILLEPVRRNTAPCIAYAAYHIKAVNPQANIIVAPSDHLIQKEDEFLSDISKGIEFVRQNDALVTLGVKPSRPETAYGYIQSGDEGIGDFIKVKTFMEKPNYELATVFCSSEEFYWNSGIFLWNVDSILTAIRTYLPTISSCFEGDIKKFNVPEEVALVEEYFPDCPNISIDYGVMEKADNVYVLGVDFGWADLGTWGSVFDIASRRAPDNNAFLTKSKVLTYDTVNCIIGIDNPSNRLTVLQGLKDYIVVESGNVLLICKKAEEHLIQKFISDAQIYFDDEYA